MCINLSEGCISIQEDYIYSEMTIKKHAIHQQSNTINHQANHHLIQVYATNCVNTEQVKM